MHNARKLLTILLWALLPGVAYAGESLVLTTGSSSAGTSIDPSWPTANPYRVEFQIHNWTLPSALTQFFRLDGLGMSAQLGPGGLLVLVDNRDTAVAGPCTVSIAGMTNALVRMQRNPAGLLVTCEAWNFDATLYNSSSQALTSTGSWFNGGYFGGVAVDIGFINVFSTLIPLGSRPPTTASRGDYTALAFDSCPGGGPNLGCLADLSGNGHNVTWTSGSPTFVTTPNQIAVALPKTFGAPAWTNWISLRAGHPSQLDGTASYSLSDGSSSVNYLWQEISGPSTLIWLSQISGTPTVTGLVFGTYNFSLQVTDVAGNVGNATLLTGAVAYDDNGVVIPPDPRVTQIFGSQIAFGQNPWSYQDQQNLFAVNAQIPYQATHNDFSWVTTGQGTVSYLFSGSSGTTLSAPISTATQTTVSLVNGSSLSLGTLPTSIYVGNVGGNNFEMIRVCSVASGSITSAVVLNVCYDGRGVSGSTPYAGGIPNPGLAAAWPTGTVVTDLRVNGTGTKFFSDPKKPVCPAGVVVGGPAPQGTIVAGTLGTVTLTAGSTTLTGSGTGWTSAVVGDFIVVAATHSSATFNFIAQISAFTSATSLTLNRPAPAGVDAGTFSYVLTQPIYLSLTMTAPTGGAGIGGETMRLLYPSFYCESETALMSIIAHDIPGLDGTTISGAQYSYKTFLGENVSGGTITPNFYGSGGLMPRSFYYRSGYGPALTLANSVDEFWVRDPEIGDGYGAGGEPLIFGGGVIGAMADLTVNTSTQLVWANVEQFTANGLVLPSAACNAWDSRDGGYIGSELTLAANYDTNSASQSRYNTALAALLTRDQTCRRNASDGYGNIATGPSSNLGEVNSFANTFNSTELGNGEGLCGTPCTIPMTISNGSTAVTGTGFIPTMCNGVDSGTITVTNGSSTATIVSGSITFELPRIYITDTTSSPIYVGSYEYCVLNGTVCATSGNFTSGTVQLGGVWPGASGTFSFMTENASTLSGGSFMMTTIWTSSADWPNVSIATALANNQALQKAWVCIYNSASSLTLNRAWDGPSGSAYFEAQYYDIGFGQSPYMLGIKTNQMRWATFNSNSTTAAGYQAILPGVGNWFQAFGADNVNNGGTLYYTIFQTCSPEVPNAGFFQTVHGSWMGIDYCASDGANHAGNLVGTERVNSAEGGAAMLQYYLGSPTPLRRATVDQFYGGIFGQTGTCAPSVASTCTGVTASNYDNGSLSSYKWPGFFFGMGGFFTSSWPAVRNAVLLPRPRVVTIGLDMGSSASANVIVTAPSGAVNTVSCSAAPCTITVDDRLGTYWYVVQRLSSAGQILSTSRPVLLPLAPQR